MQELQEKTTSSEFVQWICYLEEKEPNDFHRADYYLAQIAAEIRRGNAKHPERVTTQKMLIKFQIGKSKEISTEERELCSRMFWMGHLKMTSGR